MYNTKKFLEKNYANVNDLKRMEDKNVTYITYVAEDKETGEKVILKEVPEERKGVYEQLLNIRHENVCGINKILDISKIGEDENVYNVALIEMEYIEGETLESYVGKKGKLSEIEAIELTLHICEGLKVLHSNCIIHKDLSNTNIMITTLENKGKGVKIIDFGFSKKKDKNNKGGETRIITIGYSSNEIINGKGVDKRSDIHFFGPLLTFMLTGSLDVEYRGKYGLRKIIKKCSRDEKKYRYRSVRQLERKLRKLKRKLTPITHKKANIKVVIAALLSFILSFTAFGMLFYLPEPNNSDKYTEMAKIGDLWNDIYYDMDVAKDYDSAIKKIDEIMSDGTRGENVSVCYAKCQIGNRDYDGAAETLIEYLKNTYKYPNLTDEAKESYILLTSLESKVSENELKKIKQEKEQAEIYINKWKQATDKFKIAEYAVAIEIVDELFADGAQVDIAYFLKMECLLGLGEKSEARKVYNDYMQAKDDFEGDEIVEYDTVDYEYEQELYNRVK